MSASAAERRAQAQAAIAAALDDLRLAWRAFDRATLDLRTPGTPGFPKSSLSLPCCRPLVHQKLSPVPLTIFSKNLDAAS
jgi:hypothetical protein